MSREELERFCIECACITIQGECEMFANYYHLEEVKICYEISENGNGNIILIDGEDKTLLGEIDFPKSIKYSRNPQILLSNAFNDIMIKYNIIPLGEAKLEIQEEAEGENNE